MTKEEEAIKILSDSNILFNIQRDTSLSIRVAIETVLSMLKEKDKEIAKYEKIYKEYDCYRWVKELEKKDKIIDLMAEQIKIPEPTMKIESFDIQPKTKFGMRYLNKEEVKQYFESKVEE